MDKTGDKNIKWSREELILALAFYFKKNPLHISVNNPELLRLCQLINKVNALCYNIGLYKYPVTRTPNSVYMKLCNFLRLDPSYNGVGLSKGSKLEEEVWNNFSGNSDLLSKVETSIAKIAQDDNRYISNKRQLTKDEYENEIREGSLLFYVHKSYERAPKIINAKKSAALAKAGKLKCEICGFCFEDVYGEMGKGYIECHHIIPLSQYGQERLTKLDDLILVCANCHRMLHRYIDSLSPNELKKRLGVCNGR
ncbi:MAG: HNH endonuclease [Ruminococcaceae bacterium]|nr:HNH endonuclease [Oscillospiraceae bacterium]